MRNIFIPRISLRETVISLSCPVKMISFFVSRNILRLAVNYLYSPLNLARLSVLDFLTGPPEAGDIFLVGGGL